MSVKKDGVTYVGETKFDDSCNPTMTTSEFGLSTVTRKMRGAVWELDAFLQTLNPGKDTYNGFYLQSYEVDDHWCYPTVTLLYKGWAGVSGSGGTGAGGLKASGSPPKENASADKTEQHATATASSPEKARREIRYYSPTVTFKYSTNKEQLAPKFNGGGTKYSIVDKSSVVIKEDGKLFFGNVSAGLLAALQLKIVWALKQLTSEMQSNTPFFDNTEVWALEYQELT